MKIKEFIKLCDKSQKIAILDGNRVIVSGKQLADIPYVALSPLEDHEVKEIKTVDDILEISLGSYLYNTITYRDSDIRTGINNDLVINGNLKINGGKISVDGHECVLKNTVAISDCYNETLTADVANDTTNVTDKQVHAFTATCSCCNKKFITTDPLHDLCYDCVNDLSDIEAKTFK